MLTPNQKAEAIYKVLFENLIDNVTLEDEKPVPRKTPDYNKVFQKVIEVISEEKDLQGEHKGLKTGTLLKLAIQGGYTQTLEKQGDSNLNYQMIKHLWDKTKENKQFWEENEPDPTPEDLRKPQGFLVATTAKAAAAIVGSRMDMENFSLNLYGSDTQSLQEATQIARALKDSQAFQAELQGLKKFCGLQKIYEEDVPNRKENHGQLATTARAISKEDFTELTTWKGGALGIELESAIKLHLFTGSSGTPILDTLVKTERDKIGKTREVEPMEP